MKRTAISEKFTGFTPQCLGFFRQLRLHNDRDWFAAHRSDYLRWVAEPVRQLAAELSPVIQELDPKALTDPKRTVSRIYRDTRFAADKTPYRPNVWIAFKREVECWTATPVFFFEVTEKNFFIGMGMYSVGAATMQNFRQMIDSDAEYFWSVIKPVHRNRGLQLEAQQYKRPLPSAHRKEIEPWYQSKSIAVMGTYPPEPVLYSAKLVRFIIDRFVVMKPLYDFLWRAVR